MDVSPRQPLEVSQSGGHALASAGVRSRPRHTFNFLQVSACASPVRTPADDGAEDTHAAFQGPCGVNGVEIEVHDIFSKLGGIR